MTKREMWLANCLVWAAIWFVLGVLVFPLWLFSFLSLMCMLLPVGVPAEPQQRHYDPSKLKHNPQEWNKRG